MTSNSIHFGNAATDGKDYRDWVVGHFVEDHSSIRYSKDVEIKWSAHPAGQKREDWVTGETRVTFFILISGRFHIHFRDGDFFLTKQGDYLMWGSGIDHLWEAEEDSVVLTVRWPSQTLPTDS